MDSTTLKPYGPRKITALRRVCLPRVLVRAAGLGPEQFVTVTVTAPGVRELLVRPSGEGSEVASRVRGHSGPRRLGKTGQLTLPAQLMTDVGLKIAGLVYVIADTQTAGLRIVPSSRIRAASRASS